MGQKCNPKALRLKVVQEYENNWFSISNYSGFLIEDVKIRDYIDTRMKRFFVSNVILRRKGKDHVYIDIHSSKPGIILGKGGDAINDFKAKISAHFKKKFSINIVEEKKPDASPKLLAELVANQLERRIPFRRAMKLVVQSALKAGAEGIQVRCAGRLGGVEIARSEWYQKGRMPKNTIRCKIRYATCEANTIYGKIGVQVWVNKGEVIGETLAVKQDVL